VGELALFRIPFHMELRYRKLWQAGGGFFDAMAPQALITMPA
jgi:hypothetical protein